MISINFNIQQHTTGFQSIDALYAYYQSLSNDSKAPFKFSITKNHDPGSDFNVLCLHMPEQGPFDLDHYDLILISNSSEPLKIANPTIHHWLTTLDNCYLLCNSYLASQHAHYDRVIWYPNNILDCSNIWTNHFYCTLYQNLRRKNLKKIHDIIYINGRNETWRHHVIDLLEKNHSTIPVRMGLGDKLYRVFDSQFESIEDRSYREWVNNKYLPTINNKDLEAFNKVYYDQSVPQGIDGQFGKLTPGSLILDEYFSHRCVIFPETAWQNNEVAITEKILKCFYSKTIPWPVGGANINKLYNEIGFQTAWNLLPKSMQAWDGIKDHQERHEKMVHAMIWLENNVEVLQNQQANDIVSQNFENFLTCDTDLIVLQRFSIIIQSMMNKIK